MILVTGAKGFLGGHLVEAIGKKGLPAVSLIRPGGATPAGRVSDSVWAADLSRERDMEKLLRGGLKPQAVVHLAGRVEIALAPNPEDPALPPVAGKQDRAALELDNVRATENVARYCREAGVPHLVFASSQAVYGMAPELGVTESAPCQPLEHYAWTKVQGELLLRGAVTGGVSVTALRFPGLFGERRLSGTVYQMFRSARGSGVIAVRAAMPVPLDVIHVDDVVEAILLTLERGGKGWECLNIATGEPCSLELLARRIAEQVPGSRVSLEGVRQPVIRMDVSRARELIGFQATPSRERLRQVGEAYRREG